jgi:hypothetical protein
MNKYRVIFRNCSVSERFTIDAKDSLVAVNKAKRMLNNTALQYGAVLIEEVSV